jgi:hypothetical protein
MKKLKSLILISVISLVLMECMTSPINRNESIPATQKSDASVESNGITPPSSPAAQTETSSEGNDFSPTSDRDLTHLLTANDLVPHYCTPALHLLPSDQLLIWFDSAALLDLNAETLINRIALIQDKTEDTSEIILQKNTFTESNIGLFTQNFPCADCSLMLDRYDYNLKMIDTLDISEILGIRKDISRPETCTLSNEGNRLACIKAETGQILVHDLITGDQHSVVTIEREEFPSFRTFESISFVGEDRYLAFTTLEESGNGYGLVQLADAQLILYEEWDSVSNDIQSTDQAVYFHEAFKGPWYPASNTMIRIDLGTLEKQEIQFSDEEESFYVTVSETGQYYVTVHDISDTLDYVVGSIKIYDSASMAVLRQIDFERGFPSLVVIDETSRYLIAYYYDETPRLMLFVF